MKVKSESEVAQSCPTLSDPMDCSLPGSFVYGIFQARVLEWGAIAFSPKAQGPVLKADTFVTIRISKGSLYDADPNSYSRAQGRPEKPKKIRSKNPTP